MCFFFLLTHHSFREHLRYPYYTGTYFPIYVEASLHVFSPLFPRSLLPSKIHSPLLSASFFCLPDFSNTLSTPFVYAKFRVFLVQLILVAALPLPASRAGSFSLSFTDLSLESHEPSFYSCITSIDHQKWV